MPRKGIIKQKTTTAADIVDGLVKAAAKSRIEQCQLCGAKVISVALHYLTCPKLEEIHSDKK